MLLRKLVYWAPRVLGVLYAIFISLFALDIFSEGYTFTETLVGLFMHLLPTLAVVVLLLVAWRRPLIGGALFVLMAGAFVFFFRGNDIVGYLIISGPLFLIGILFLVDFYLNERANDLISE
jgi:hypothetical protein